jgi:hypothetical protein
MHCSKRSFGRPAYWNRYRHNLTSVFRVHPTTTSNISRGKYWRSFMTLGRWASILWVGNWIRQPSFGGTLSASFSNVSWSNSSKICVKKSRCEKFEANSIAWSVSLNSSNRRRIRWMKTWFYTQVSSVNKQSYRWLHFEKREPSGLLVHYQGVQPCNDTIHWNNCQRVIIKFYSNWHFSKWFATLRIYPNLQ